MVRTIARKEFVELWRDGRFRVVGLILLLLLLAVLAGGWKHYGDLRRAQEAAQAATRRQWDTQEAKNPHSAAHFGMYAFKPQTPLAYVDRGVDDYLGVAVWLEAHKQNPFLYRPVEDATGVARFVEGTAANVLQLLVPLVIIMLAFSAFAGERERGTLRQLLSVGVPARKLLLGKALGITGALLLLLLPVTVIGVLALALVAPRSDLALSLPRLGVMVFVYLLYFGGFGALALLVSARARSARAALVVLFAVWIVNSLLVPRVVADAGEALYPTPTRTQFWAQIERDMKEGVDGHNAANLRTEELKQQVLRQYGVQRVEELPVNFAGLSLQAGEEYGNAVFDRRYGELWRLYERQNRLRQAAAVIAPLEAVRSFSSGLAGTDFAQHRAFTVAAEQYRRMLNKTMNENLAYNSRGGDTEYMADSSLWRSIAPFKFTPPSLGAVLRQQVWGLIILLLWFGVTAALALFTARRLKV